MSIYGRKYRKFSVATKAVEEVLELVLSHLEYKKKKKNLQKV